MKEVLGVIMEIIFLSVSLGIAFLLIYFGFRASRQNKTNNIDLKDIEKQGKFIGRT